MNRRPEIGAVELVIRGRGGSPRRMDHEVGRDALDDRGKLVLVRSDRHRAKWSRGHSSGQRRPSTITLVCAGDARLDARL